MPTAARRVFGVALSALLLTFAAPASAVEPQGSVKKAKTDASDPGKPPYDVRDHQRQPVPGPEDAAAARDLERLSDRLGRQGVVDVDGQTNTAKFVGKLDGFLTGPSGDDPAQIALDYVRAHEGVFGLTAKEIDDLKLVRRYTDEGGTTHLVWAQVLDGITAFDNDVHANVAADGRLINVSGSPVDEFATRTTAPDLSPSEAVTKALTDAGRPGGALTPRDRGTADQLTTFPGGHDARLVLFTERPGDTHLAWEVTAHKDGDEIYDYLIDAHSGELLYRQNTVNFAAANLSVWEYAPNIHNAPGFVGAPSQSGTQSVHGTLFGGDPIVVNDASALNGPYTHVYPDVNDDNQPDGEVPASSGTTWNYPFTTFNPAFTNCGPVFPQCSWDAFTGNSWQANLRQNAAQVYYYVNNFHDWLQREPNIGFTPASGNFETAGGDAVRAEVVDGADTDTVNHLPNNDHANNANMSTQRDGTPPRMQMYLFDGQGDSPFGNGGDDASVIYHEYAHGLSNRLVTGGTGASTLRSFHARAMGEGWSDFYAMDYLFGNNLDTGDTASPGEVALGFYITGGVTSSNLRSEPLDCPVSNGAVAGCPGGNTLHQGGYSLADMGSVINGPEFHADGEIWAQTLWQIRQATTPAIARRVITDGMRLSPPDPSFLDMRNAILQADQVAFGGAHLGTLWGVFANRGMGPGAAVDSGADTTPVADFSPPANPNGATVTGRVTDAATGAGIANAYVHFDANGAPGDFATFTNGNGDYSLSAVQPGTIARVLVAAPGFGHAERNNVAIGGGAVDFALERNFAAAASGGGIAGFSGPDFSADSCGPAGAIDGTLASGWGSTSPNNPGQGLGGTKAVVVQLPQALDVSRIAVDPTANCGDSDSASTGQFTVEVSGDGTNFRPVAASSFNASQLRRVNVVANAASNVRFVRYTMVAPQRQLTSGGDGQGGQDSGVQFMDTSEIEVFGAPAATVGGGGGGGGGGPGITRDLIAPIGKLGLVAKQKLRTALAMGMKVTVECNEPCAATLTATLDAKTAKKLKLLPRKSKAKTVKVASGKLGLGSGKRTATLKFTGKAKKLLKRQKKLKLVVTAALADASANEASAKLSASLKR